MAIQAQIYSNNLEFGLGEGPQDYVGNGFGLNEFYLQQKQQQQQFMQQHQLRNQNLCFENSGLVQKNNNNYPPRVFSQSIPSQMEKESQEVDRFICLQNDRLRLALLELNRRQTVTILKKYESRAQVLLRQKDEETAELMNRTTELENFLRRIEFESQTWQRVAKENEAMVMSLNNTIEKAKELRVFLSDNGPEDAESCCEDAGERRGFQENEEQRPRNMICKSCNFSSSCMVFLPCQHLSSCKACEPLLDSCPVCRLVKQSSIEALF